KFVIDRPQVFSGRALQTIQGGLQIEGWAIAREGVESIDIFVDDQHLGAAKYGLRREDVGNSWPDWQNAHLSGYAQFIPARGLSAGEHSIRVELRTHTGRTKAIEFSIEAETIEENAICMLQRKMVRSEIDFHENILRGRNWFPQFGVVLGIPDV